MGKGKSVSRSRVRVNDIEISYLHTGRPGGPSVVLLHGMAETAESCWSHQLEALSEDFDCYAVDLRGHGQTTVGDADGTLEQLGTDLLGFLRAVTGPAVVVGFSMGGTLALWAAAQRSELVQHVITLGGSSVVSSTVAAFFRDKAATVARRDLLTLHRQMSTEVHDVFVANPDRAPSYGARRIAAVGEGDGYANAALAMARMREHPLQPALSRIVCPVDVVSGACDTWCPRKAAEIILGGLRHRDVRFTELPRVGHLMSVDAPDLVSTCLRRLITSVPTADGSAVADREPAQ
jgi:3-oxoadipate enol-lactonase